MDTLTNKLPYVSPETRTAATDLNAELLGIYADLLICLRTNGDIAAELLTVHGKLSDLSERAERLSAACLAGEEG